MDQAQSLLPLTTPTSGLKPELDNFEFTMEQSEKGYKTLL